MNVSYKRAFGYTYYNECRKCQVRATILLMAAITILLTILLMGCGTPLVNKHADGSYQASDTATNIANAVRTVGNAAAPATSGTSAMVGDVAYWVLTAGLAAVCTFFGKQTKDRGAALDTINTVVTTHPASADIQARILQRAAVDNTSPTITQHIG